MSEPFAKAFNKKHICERDNSNIIFFSALWRNWALKIINEGVRAGVLDPVYIIIKYCPYCGVELK